MAQGNDKIPGMVSSRAVMSRSVFAPVLLAAVLAGCHDGRAEDASPPPPQKTATARPAPTPAPPSSAPQHEGWIGVIVARESVDVTATGQGRLAAVHVKIGDPVRRGDRIATLDTQVVAQDLEMARSAVRGAEADVGRAAAEANEAKQRNDRRKGNPDFFSKEDIAQAELQMKTTEAALEAAQARLSEQRSRVRQLQASVGQNEIRAPFDGRVAERFVDAGTVVGPGTPIVRLISGGDLIVRAAVPPEEARSLTVGRPVTINVRSLGLALPGRIERIAPEVDAASQMILVEARLEPSANGAARLQTGLVVEVAPASTP
jgi:RND family efflux transporter MFP subunit